MSKVTNALRRASSSIKDRLFPDLATPPVQDSRRMVWVSKKIDPTAALMASMGFTSLANDIVRNTKGNTYNIGANEAKRQRLHLHRAELSAV